MAISSAPTAANASASRGSVVATSARTGSPGAPWARRASAMLNAGIRTKASPSSMSSVAANSGTVHATRKASVSLPAPNSRASDWSRTSPSRAPATERTAVMRVAWARNFLETGASSAGSLQSLPLLSS